MSLLSHPQPACREAIFELPSVVEDSGKRRAPPDVPRGNTRSVASSPSSGRKAGLILAAALAALPGFIPESAVADDPTNLYISGGGGGGGNSKGTGGTGGGGGGSATGGEGQYNKDGGSGSNGGGGGGTHGAGGGAYVGDGSEPNASGGVFVTNASTGGEGAFTDSTLSSLFDVAKAEKGSALGNEGGKGGAALLVNGILPEKYSGIFIAAGNGGEGDTGTLSGNLSGDGGDAFLKEVTLPERKYSTIFIKAGGGGEGGGHKDTYPGNGGNASLETISSVSVGTLTITAGGGGSGGVNAGGEGGDALLKAADVSVDTSLTITAGSGGNGGNKEIHKGDKGSHGGDGGDAFLEVSGSVSVGELEIASGNAGATRDPYIDEDPEQSIYYPDGGTGGTAIVNVGTLDVTRDTKLTLDGTSIWDKNARTGVLFQSIDIAGGHTLAVTRDATRGGNYTFNTLNVRGKKGAPAIYQDSGGTLDAVGKTLNFYLASDVVAGDTMLTVVKDANGDGNDGEANITNATVNVGIEPGSALKEGDKVTLMHAGGGLESNQEEDEVNIADGVSRAYTLTLGTDENNLFVTVTGVGEQTEPPAEECKPPDDCGPTPPPPPIPPIVPPTTPPQLSSLALTNQGADLIAGRGMESVTACAGQAMRATDTNYCVFGLVSGSALRYDTGSHLKMNSLSAMTGFSRSADLASGRLTLGAFLEYGDGFYDTSGRMPDNGNAYYGNGDTYYVGGGFLAHLDFANDFYFETSVRVGQMNNNSDMTVILSDGSRRETGFKFAVPYIGLYAGAGYVWPVTQETSLEWYGKYFWTWMEGKSTSLRTGERVSFDAMDSHRLRAGLRFSHMLTETLSAYAGVAYEHEFDAKVRVGAYSYGLTGGTGFGEIGLRVKPTPSWPLSIDFGVQGHAGKREGVTASVKVEYRF